MEEFEIPKPPRSNYLNAEYGLKSWLLTKDHKRIALLYLATITLFFVLGGIFALIIRLALLTPALGNFLIPLMIGARDLAFPRINLLSWYIYVIGGIFTLTAAITGGVDT